MCYTLLESRATFEAPIMKQVLITGLFGAGLIWSKPIILPSAAVVLELFLAKEALGLRVLSSSRKFVCLYSPLPLLNNIFAMFHPSTSLFCWSPPIWFLSHGSPAWEITTEALNTSASPSPLLCNVMLHFYCRTVTQCHTKGCNVMLQGSMYLY